MATTIDFALPDQTGTIRQATDFAGAWLIVYFYPQDDTPGCTIEACEFRDGYKDLKEAGVEVVGISKDSVSSHLKFAEKYGLNFPLLSDETTHVMEAYGAWGPKKMFGKEYTGASRVTLLVRPDGTIAKKYPKVQPSGHAAKILADVKQLRES